MLLAGPDAEEWCRCAPLAAWEEHIALDVWRPGSDGLEDPTGHLSDLHGIEPDGCVLVRPDGFVSWRARDAHEASVAALRVALSGALARS